MKPARDVVLASRRRSSSAAAANDVVPQLMPIGMTAKYMGVSRWFVQDLLKTGELRCVALNGNPRRRRVYKPDADAWIERNLIAGNAELLDVVSGRKH